MQMIFSESERLRGGLHGPPWKGTTQPLAARPEPPAPLQPPQDARHRQGIPGSSAAPHASGPLGPRFGPGDGRWGGSDRLAGETGPGATGGVTHRREWRLRPQLRDSPTGARCPVPRVLAAATRLPDPQRRSLCTGRRGLSALPHSSSRGARWEAPNWTAGARHAGIPRAGFHSNQPTVTLAVRLRKKPWRLPCFTGDGAPGSAVTFLQPPRPLRLPGSGEKWSQL